MPSPALKDRVRTGLGRGLSPLLFARACLPHLFPSPFCRLHSDLMLAMNDAQGLVRRATAAPARQGSWLDRAGPTEEGLGH